MILVISLVAHRTFVVESTSDTAAPNAVVPPKCCNSSLDDLHRVEIKFKTTVVENEYIVRFDDYYTSQTREEILRAALNDSEVRAVGIVSTTISCDERFDCIFSGEKLANLAKIESGRRVSQ